jgi:phospholipase A1
MRRILVLLAMFAGMFAFPRLGVAQASGQLVVRVLNSEGRAMPGVQVTVRSETVSRVALTDDNGVANFSLPVGRYSVEVRFVGFAARTFDADVVSGAASSFEVQLGGTAPIPGLGRTKFFDLYDVNYFTTGFDGEKTDRPVTEKANQVKFSVAVRYKILNLQKCDSCPNGLYAVFSQKSLWHLYDESAPFFDNNYSPGVIGYVQSPAPSLAFFAGVFHESNGRDSSFSRGWNRVVGGASVGALNRTWISGSLTLWHQWALEPTNRDLLDFAGRGEAELYLQPFQNGADGGWLTVNARSRVWGKNPITNVELNVLAQLPDRFMLPPSIFAQYFNGYAENLLSYNEHRNVFRIGLGVVR